MIDEHTKVVVHNMKSPKHSLRTKNISRDGDLDTKSLNPGVGSTDSNGLL
jgi:hypothetical protein